MRNAVFLGLLLFAAGLTGAEARDRPIEELPKDVWELAFVWTEPIKSVARAARRFDPISGLWFGLLEGSVRSVERAVELILRKPAGPSATPPEGPLLRYSF